MTAPIPFHLAFAVTDIDATREFYVNKLGCKMGRSAERWIDFDFFGHQISAHLVDGALSPAETTEFIIEPTTRFAGEVGEQATMFFRDPSGNALEFKTFRDSAMIFAN